MAWEQLVEIPSLLREGFIVHFVGGWPDAVNKNNKYFQVERAFQIKYDVGRVIAAGDTQDISFGSVSAGIDANDIGLLPAATNTLYEILMGFKGYPLVYPRYENAYYLRLQVTNVTPDITNERLRYLGFWEEKDSPFDAPKLREYTVSSQDAPVLRCYGDADIDQAIRFRFLVNSCRLGEIASPTQEQRKVAREVRWHGWFNYSQ